MIQLANCTQCKGFLGLAALECPHCSAPVSRIRKAAIALATIAGGGAVSMTMMACYGSPCASDSNSPACKDYLNYLDAGPDASADDIDASASGEDAAP